MKTLRSSYLIFTTSISQFSGNKLEIEPSNTPHVLFVLPPDFSIDLSDIENIKNCANAIFSTDYDFQVNNDNIHLTYKFKMENMGKRFLIVTLPHMRQKNTRLLIEGESLGVYRSNRGNLELHCTDELELIIPMVNLRENFADFIDQSKLNSPEAADIFAADYKVLTDQEVPSGVYFRGKYFKNLIDLWEIAGYLNDDKLKGELTARIKSLLLSEIANFRADSESGLVYHLHPEFGNEKGNDHNLQYGYYIASYARFYDEFNVEEKERVNSLMDIFIREGVPGYFRNSSYPLNFRFLDFYESHSWVDAKAQFLDGNNQESSSEALYYWFSIWLWGRVQNDKKLTDLAQLAFCIEKEGGQTYWWLSENSYIKDSFAKPIITLVWGGKSDYATWFSAEDDKLIGIQILPMNPSSLSSLRLNAEPGQLARIISYYDNYFLKGGSRDFYNYYLFFKKINKNPIDVNLRHEKEFIPLSLLYLLKS